MSESMRIAKNIRMAIPSSEHFLKVQNNLNFLGRPEPPRKKRGAVAKKGEKEVELTWAQKYMAKMQEGKVINSYNKFRTIHITTSR